MSDQTRERILQAAAEVFGAKGYAGASTRTLAAAASVNVATIAYHFGSKEGLYRAVLDAMYDTLLGYRFPAELPAGRADRIRIVVASLFRYARAHHRQVQLLLREVVAPTRLPTEARDRHRAAALSRLLEVQERLDLDLARDRLALLSLNHLLARYAVSSDEDLLPFTATIEAWGGEPGATPEGDPKSAPEGDPESDPATSPEAVIAAHLGEVAVRLLAGT